MSHERVWWDGCEEVWEVVLGAPGVCSSLQARVPWGAGGESQGDM